MDSKEYFESIDTEDKLPEKKGRIRGPIIKNDLIRVSKSVTVKIAKDRFGSNMIDYVQPIMQGQDIVGITHTCSCGKSTEIMFEFDNSEDISTLQEGD